MSALLEELLEIIRRHMVTFFGSYNVKMDLETAYSRISAVRLTIDKRRYVDITLVEDTKTGKRKQSCYYIVDGKDVWGFNDVPHHRELSSFPYHEHLHRKPKETKKSLFPSSSEMILPYRSSYPLPLVFQSRPFLRRRPPMTVSTIPESHTLKETSQKINLA